MNPRAVLLDIEGTTTPVAFVYETLFPYARARLKEYLATHPEQPDAAADIARLRSEYAADREAGLDPPEWNGDAASAAAYLAWLMDADRKSTGLKAIQGRIWEEGYRSGQLYGVVYDDVPRAFEGWCAQGRVIAIFSSGSVLAQQLIFAHTNHGDLTSFLTAYFDTTTGAKRSPESYRRIAAALGFETSEMIFYSDVAEELDAARAAGMHTVLCVREGDAPDNARHPVVREFGME